MNNNFLIPANSKKSMLILNIFNTTDLFIFGGGIAATLILILLNFNVTTFKGILFIISPTLICSFLVLPLPNVHNIWTFMLIIYKYFTNRRTYYWKGWCMDYGEKESK